MFDDCAVTIFSSEGYFTICSLESVWIFDFFFSFKGLNIYVLKKRKGFKALLVLCICKKKMKTRKKENKAFCFWVSFSFSRE